MTGNRIGYTALLGSFFVLYSARRLWIHKIGASVLQVNVVFLRESGIQLWNRKNRIDGRELFVFQYILRLRRPILEDTQLASIPFPLPEVHLDQFELVLFPVSAFGGRNEIIRTGSNMLHFVERPFPSVSRSDVLGS